MNYFDLLGLEQKYDLSQGDIRKQYLLMQASYHPDRAKDTSEKVRFLDISMKLNEAYKILQDDYLRAEYLLKLGGAEFDDNTLKNVLSGPELEKFFSEFEIIEETQDSQLLEEMKNIKLGDKAEITRKISHSFASNKLNEALDLTVRLKYLTSLLSNITMKLKHADN